MKRVPRVLTVLLALYSYAVYIVVADKNDNMLTGANYGDYTPVINRNFQPDERRRPGLKTFPM